MKKFKQVLISTIVILSNCILIGLPTYALEDSKIVTGTKNLAADGLKVLIGLSVGLTALLAGFNLVKMQSAEDEMKPKFKKNVKTIIIAGALVVVIESVITVIFSYYQ